MVWPTIPVEVKNQATVNINGQPIVVTLQHSSVSGAQQLSRLAITGIRFRQTVTVPPNRIWRLYSATLRTETSAAAGKRHPYISVHETLPDDLTEPAYFVSTFGEICLSVGQPVYPNYHNWLVAWPGAANSDAERIGNLSTSVRSIIGEVRGGQNIMVGLLSPDTADTYEFRLFYWDEPMPGY